MHEDYGYTFTDNDSYIFTDRGWGRKDDSRSSNRNMQTNIVNEITKSDLNKSEISKLESIELV